MEAFLSADTEELSLGAITVRLYNDHVPLYFWLFRMVSFYLFKGSATIWIGLSINLFFYLIALIAVYCIFVYLLKNPWLSGGLVFLACVTNRLMLEQATTLRMYMMLLCLELITLIVGIWIVEMSSRNRISIFSLLALYVVSTLGFLTHYDFWIFYAVSATVFCLWMLYSNFKNKGNWFGIRLKMVLLWTINFILSLLTTIWLFPYCRWNLNKGKGKMALQSLIDFSPEKLEQIVWGFRRLVATSFGDTFPTIIGLFIIFGCIIGGVFVLRKEKEYRKLFILVSVVLIALTYQLIVCFTMPAGKEERYLWGTYTLLMLCVSWCGILLLQKLFSKIKIEGVGRVICQCFVYVLLFGAIMLGELTIIDRGNGIAYLSYPHKDVKKLKEYSGIPWVVYGPTDDVYSYYDWLIPEQICFITQMNTPADIEAICKMSNKDEFVLYVSDDYYSQAELFFESVLGQEIKCTYLTTSSKRTVYLVK